MEKPKGDGNRTVVVVTEAYPFTRLSERAYFEPELEELSRAFDEVIIVPRHKRENDGEMPEYPNVSLSTEWLESGDYRNRWRRLRFLPASWTKGKVKDEKRVKMSLTYGMSALSMASFFEKWMERNNLNPEKTVFYTFWFDYSTTGLALLKERKHRELRIVSRVHSFYETSDVASRWKRMTALRLNAVFPISNFSQELFKQLTSGEEGPITEVIPLGCDGEVREREQIDRNEIRFFTACRLEREKSLEKMLELMDALATARTERIVWIIAGGGEEEANFRRMTTANRNPNLTIDFRGVIANRDVHRIYRDEQIDWGLLISPNEGLPVALCEAMTHGVPVVANDVGGVQEIVNDETGILLASNPEKEEFVRGIAPWLDSSYRYEQLSKGARCFWEKNLDSKALRKKFVDRIRDLI